MATRQSKYLPLNMSEWQGQNCKTEVGTDSFKQTEREIAH